jgi:glycosyltransferase involved in cell wall biosynthesis
LQSYKANITRKGDITRRVAAGPFVLVGWKTQEEVCRLLAESHIFILASILSSNGDFEGQGIVLQETQGMGLPGVCTNHNGSPKASLMGNPVFLFKNATRRRGLHFVASVGCRTR